MSAGDLWIAAAVLYALRTGWIAGSVSRAQVCQIVTGKSKFADRVPERFIWMWAWLWPVMDCHRMIRGRK